jgi:phosphatidylglycerol:prolipoprotein diacylglycerol transferase
MWRLIPVGENSFVPAYNLFVGLGIAMAMLHLQYEKQFSQWSLNQKHTIHSGLLLSIFVGFICAFTFDAYTRGIPIHPANFRQVGLTLLGGVLGGFLTFTIFLQQKSIPVLNTFNLLTPSFCLSHALGRIGCFFAGCCFGSPTSCPLGVRFPQDSLVYDHYRADIHVHPTQLYESVFVLLVYLILSRSLIKNKFSFYLVSYAIFRFFVEFIRADERGTLLGQAYISPSQFISLVLLFTGIFLIWYSRKATDLRQL